MIRTIGAQAPIAGKLRAHEFRTLCAIVSVGLCGLVACRHAPPEQALRNTIAEMQKAAQAHDIDALLEPIAEDFVGPEVMDRQAFRRYATLIALQNQQMGLHLGPLNIQLFDQRALVKFTAATSGGVNGLPERMQVYEVETGWRLEDGEWRLISAQWEPKL